MTQTDDRPTPQRPRPTGSPHDSRPARTHPTRNDRPDATRHDSPDWIGGLSSFLNAHLHAYSPGSDTRRELERYVAALHGLYRPDEARRELDVAWIARQASKLTSKLPPDSEEYGIAFGIAEVAGALASAPGGGVGSFAEALRRAPMPIRESITKGEAWHERYDEWWHEYASEDGIRRLAARAAGEAGKPLTRTVLSITRNLGAGFARGDIEGDGHDVDSWWAGFGAAVRTIRERLGALAPVLVVGLHRIESNYPGIGNRRIYDDWMADRRPADAEPRLTDPPPELQRMIDPEPGEVRPRSDCPNPRCESWGGCANPRHPENQPEPTEGELEAFRDRLRGRLERDGHDPDVMTVRGTLLMRPEPEVRAALDALDRIAERLGADPEPGEGEGDEPRAACHDCGLPYDDPGFCDLVVPNDIWNKLLSPTGDEGGLLCPTCMVRAARRAGLDGVAAVWRSGPFVPENDDA